MDLSTECDKAKSESLMVMRTQPAATTPAVVTLERSAGLASQPDLNNLLLIFLWVLPSLPKGRFARDTQIQGIHRSHSPEAWASKRDESTPHGEMLLQRP